MIEFWNDFLHDKDAFLNVVMPILMIAGIIAFWLFMGWLLGD